MAFEALQSELELLMTRMQNEPEDRHELYLVIRQKLNEMKLLACPCRTTWFGLSSSLKRNSRKTIRASLCER